jgi:hypothetical protein
MRYTSSCYVAIRQFRQNTSTPQYSLSSFQCSHPLLESRNLKALRWSDFLWNDLGTKLHKIGQFGISRPDRRARCVLLLTCPCKERLIITEHCASFGTGTHPTRVAGASAVSLRYSDQADRPVSHVSGCRFRVLIVTFCISRDKRRNEEDCIMNSLMTCTLHQIL